MKKIILVLLTALLPLSLFGCQVYTTDNPADDNTEVPGEGDNDNNDDEVIPDEDDSQEDDENLDEDGSDDTEDLVGGLFENFINSLNSATAYQIQYEFDNEEINYSVDGNKVYDNNNNIFQELIDTRYYIYTYDSEWEVFISLDSVLNYAIENTKFDIKDFNKVDNTYESEYASIEYNDEMFAVYLNVEGTLVECVYSYLDNIELTIPSGVEVLNAETKLKISEFYNKYASDSFKYKSNDIEFGSNYDGYSEIHYYTYEDNLSWSTVYVKYDSSVECGYIVVDKYGDKLDTVFPSTAVNFLNPFVLYSSEEFMYEFENSYYDEINNTFVFSCSDYVKTYEFDSEYNTLEISIVYEDESTFNIRYFGLGTVDNFIVPEEE